MKKTPNQLHFESLPPHAYLKTFEAATRHITGFRNLLSGALGYAPETDGFIALHIEHSFAALPREIPACLVLKQAGFAVILSGEAGFHKSVDAQINGKSFEIKQIANAKSMKKSFLRHFDETKRKVANLLLHIDQPATAEQLRSNLYYAVHRTPGIHLIWVVWRNRLFQFEREAVLKGHHAFL